MTVHNDKAQLRHEYQQRRTDFALESGAEASDRITELILQLPAYRHAKSVMMYVPFREEVATWDLMDAVLRSGKRLVLPKTVPTEHGLLLCQVTDLKGQLAIGNYGIVEPLVDRVVQVALDDLDLVLVPALIFGLDGYRVGYGGGYYDRMLAVAKRSRTKFFGLGFDVQVMPRVPRGRFDQQLDGVVTEKRVVIFEIR